MNISINKIIKNLEILRDDTICDIGNLSEQITKDTINLSLGACDSDLSEVEILRFDANALNVVILSLKNLSKNNTNIFRDLNNL